VSTKDAIIILVSDFGRDEIKTGLSWDEISARVSEETRKILREELMVQRIQHVIPFVPVPSVDCQAKTGTPTSTVEEFVHLLLEQISSHSYLQTHRIKLRSLKGDTKAITKQLFQLFITYPQYCERNYRGLENLFNSKIVAEILKKMPDPLPNNQQQEVSVTIRYPFETSQVEVLTPHHKTEL